MDKSKICQTCFFFEPDIVITEYGLCRRNAPYVLMKNGRLVTRFAETTPDNWCGEHSPVSKPFSDANTSSG